MKLEAKFLIVYADDRLLVTADIPGCPSNTVDVSAIDAEEIDWAFGLVARSVRRQIVELLSRLNIDLASQSDR